MKKIFIPLIFAAIILVSGCTSNGGGDGTENTTDQTIYIEIGDVIPDDVCTARGLKEKVMVIYQTGCPACGVTLPRLEEIEQELGTEFEYINIANEDGIERIKELKLMPYWAPTVLIKCRAYGVLSKEEYSNLIAGD